MQLQSNIVSLRNYSQKWKNKNLGKGIPNNPKGKITPQGEAC